MSDDSIEVYQMRVLLSGISPIIWRRFLIRNDSTISDLHYALQILMNWGDYHLNQFVIRGKRYGVAQPGGICFSDNPDQVFLSQFHFRLKEKFLYEYNFNCEWKHEIRIEKIIQLEAKKTYPICIGGARLAPPEDCGGTWNYMSLKYHYSEWYILDRFMEIIEQKNMDFDREELRILSYWINIKKFDRRAVNNRLKKYSQGDETWMYEEEAL